jgi:hypothetical protein
MEPMPNTPAHAKPSGYDHAWVLVVVAGFALYDVWESWTQVGNKSGYAHGTGWTLTVIVEAFAAYCLFAWFDAPGRRSRQFAMWSAFAVLGLSLIGQGSSTLAAHAMPPIWLAVFVKDLPVVVLALIALLVHVRRLDRAGAEEAGRERAEAQQRAASEGAAADERTALRADLEAARAELAGAHADLATARTELTRTAAKADAAERKLAAQKSKRTRAQAPAARRTKASDAAPHAAPGTNDRTMLPDDFDARTQALEIWLANPQISGKDLGEAVGMKERWGQLRKAEFAATAPARQDPED